MRRFAVVAALLSAATAFGQNGSWESRAPLPITVSQTSSAAIGDRVYVVCGRLPGRLSSDRLFIYDALADAWSEGARTPIGQGLGADHCNVAAVGGKIFVLGGIRLGRGFLSNQIFEYDPALDRWSERPRMLTPRGGAGVAVIGPKIYVVGGQATQFSGTAFEAFDVESGLWEILPSLPGPRSRLTAQAVGGKVYAIGGRSDAGGGVRGEVFEYDPAAGAWSLKAPAPTPREGHGSGVIDGKIIVFGGEAGGRAVAPVEEYDPETDAWRALASMPLPRQGLAGAFDGAGRIFASGGGPAPGESFSDAHEVFRLTPAPSPEFSAASVVGAAGFQPTLAPGAMISVFGLRLSAQTLVADSLPLPTDLGGVRVLADDRPIPLVFVAPEQINAVLPLDLGSTTRLRVFGGGRSSAPIELPLAAAAPGVFTLTLTGAGQAAALINGTATVAGRFPGVASRPARAGETVALFGTGFGAVTNPPPLGEGSSGSPLSRTLTEPTVAVGGRSAAVGFSGLAPGFPGLYQVNLVVPDGLAAGDAPVRVDIAGATTNAVTIGVE